MAQISPASRNRSLRAAQAVLDAVDFPFERLSATWSARAARVLLCIAGIKPGDSFRKTLRDFDPMATKGSREVVDALSLWDVALSRGSYDDVRRNCIEYLVGAGLCVQNPDHPSRDLHSPKTSYGLSQGAIAMLRAHGTSEWESTTARFTAEQPSLREEYNRRRVAAGYSLVLPDGLKVQLEHGPHNWLQHQVITKFASNFVQDGELLYVGSFTNRTLYRAEERLRELGVFELEHDRLPDVMIYSPIRHWLFVIEAVHSTGPVSHEKRRRLEAMLKESSAGRVYVSAFRDRSTFRRYIADIAWETEVWIAEEAHHLIHFNGDRFLGPYET